MQNIPNGTSLQIAKWCLNNSIVPLPIEGKRPTVNDWPNFRVSAQDLSQHFNGGQQNIGALLGPASGGLVDVDLDWPECEMLADTFLPGSWRFGRNDDAGQFHLRHVLLRCPDISNQDWKAPAKVFSKPLSIVQILAAGKQVVLPGSRHESGQEIVWREKPAADRLQTIDRADLVQRVNRLAGTALLVRLWPDLEGSRHDVALALAGACHHAGWSVEETAAMGTALLTAAHDTEKRDRIQAMKTTLQRAADGQAVTGLPKLAELLPGDVLTCLQKWWQLGEDALQLTFNGQPLGSNGSGSSGTDWGNAQWHELLPFAETLVSHKDYPIDALFPIMAAATRDVMAYQQAPAALAAQAVLANTNAAAHQHFDVVIGMRQLPISLWLVLIGMTGERKTSSDKLARKQLDLRRKEARIIYTTAMAAWRQAKKDGEEMARPRQPTWVITRGSMQGLLKRLDDASPFTLYSSADAGSFFGGYAMTDNRTTESISVLSDLWSGEAHTTALAKMDEASELYGRRLAFSLMLQPNIAADLFQTELLEGQGFLSRCLPALPASTIGRRLYHEPPQTPGLDCYYAAVDKLLTKQPNMDLELGDLSPVPLQLADDAKAIWIAYHDKIETNMGPGGDYADAKAVCNKMPEQALRLAGTIAAIEGHNSISAGVMSSAIQLADYYLGEWLTLADKLIAHKASVSEPKQLWEWCEKRRDTHHKNTLKLSDVYKSGPGFLRKKSDKARVLVDELIRRGYVRRLGSTEYEIRPADQC